VSDNGYFLFEYDSSRLDAGSFGIGVHAFRIRPNESGGSRSGIEAVFLLPGEPPAGAPRLMTTGTVSL